MTRNRQTIVLALLLLVLAAPMLAQVEPPHIHFQRLEIALWPEYDQPATLVMYRGWLSADVQLPITVTLPFPAEVTALNAVAKRGPATGLLVAPHTVENNGDWNLVHLQTDMPEIRVEFYMDLPTDQAGRSFTFEWPGGPVIDEASYEVMQPLGATNFSASPSSGPPALGQDGLLYQREILGPITEGASFFIQFAYETSTPDLTASALQPVAPPPQQALPPAQAAPPASAAQPIASGSDNSIWFVVLPIVFLAGLAAGWILLKSGKEEDS